MESLYGCECGYKTYDRSRMRSHLNRKKPCTNKNMSSINIDDLMIRKKKLTNISELTTEEKTTRKNELANIYNLKKAIPGGRTDIQFVNCILMHMKQASIRRKHQIPEFTFDTLFKLLCENLIYKVNTPVGSVEIPLLLTNGYINSASVDRIDNSKGYTYDNVRVIPRFLNVSDDKMSKINPEDWTEILTNRERPRNTEELTNIINHIENNFISSTFFYKLANSAYWHSKNNNLSFDFESIGECSLFLIKKFIEQGGRCAYIKIPIYLESKHKYKTSIERINHTIGYTKENTVLIVSSLNCPPGGPKNNNTCALGLNLDKLNEWIFFTEEKQNLVNKLIEFEISVLKNIDFGNKLRKTSSKYNGVCVKEGKFSVRILYNNKRHYVGSFKNENDAALAYNMKATEFYGDKANLNVIKD
jgi:hypothetical protein